MTISTPIRILTAAAAALALGVPLAQAAGSPPDAFERAVARASSDTYVGDSHQRSQPTTLTETGAPPDAFERAVNNAVQRSLVGSDSHDRSETPVGVSTIAIGDDGSLAWVDLSIGVFIGFALAGLGALAALMVRGRGRVAHS